MGALPGVHCCWVYEMKVNAPKNEVDFSKQDTILSNDNSDDDNANTHKTYSNIKIEFLRTEPSWC